MSLSNQFNSPRARYKPRKSWLDIQREKALHWTKYLELNPLRDQPRRVYEQGDYDTRIDNWDADDDDNLIKETT
jgi:hypothetical protein